MSWKSLIYWIYSYWNRGQVIWVFGRNTSTVKSRKKAPLQRRRVQLTKEIRRRFQFEDSWFVGRRRWSRWSSSSGSSLRNTFTVVVCGFGFQNVSETPSYGDFLNKTLLKRWQTQQSLPHVSEHARISELSPEKHFLLESVLSTTYLRCARITESHCLPLFRYVCIWLERSQNVLNDIVNEVSAVSVKRSVK